MKISRDLDFYGLKSCTRALSKTSHFFQTLVQKSTTLIDKRAEETSSIKAYDDCTK